MHGRVARRVAPGMETGTECPENPEIPECPENWDIGGGRIIWEGAGEGGEEGGGGGRLWEVAKSKERVKAKLEGGTKRNRGRMLGEALGEGNRFAAGWMEYFRLPAAKTWLSETEGWLGRRLRCYRRKECKRRIGVIHAT